MSFEARLWQKRRKLTDATSFEHQLLNKGGEKANNAHDIEKAIAQIGYSPSPTLFVNTRQSSEPHTTLPLPQIQIPAKVENSYEDLYSQRIPPKTSNANDPRAILTRHHIEDLSNIDLREIRISLRTAVEHQSFAALR